jgi:hypothetical protein
LPHIVGFKISTDSTCFLLQNHHVSCFKSTHENLSGQGAKQSNDQECNRPHGHEGSWRHRVRHR